MYFWNKGRDVRGKLRGWVGKIIELGRKLGGGNLEKQTHENREMVIY